MFNYVEVNTYKSYNVDPKYTLEIFNTLKEVHDLSIKHGLDYHLIGHIALALLSKKMYRTPHDLDILINAKNLNNWYDALKNKWCFRGNLEFIKKFNELKFKKFAASNTNNCAIHSNESQIYNKKDKNVSTILNIGIVNNFSNYDKTIASWVYHNPNQNNSQSIKQIEFDDNKFRLWFHTNQVGAGFIGEVNLIKDNNTTIIPCTFHSNQELSDKSLSDWWVSDWINNDEFNECKYTICLYKKSISVRLFHKISNISMDLYLNQEQFQSSYELVHIDNMQIKITQPELSLWNKYNRTKDNDDYEFYKFMLLNKFENI
jgi:hypothetical protein